MFSLKIPHSEKEYCLWEGKKNLYPGQLFKQAPFFYRPTLTKIKARLGSLRTRTSSSNKLMSFMATTKPLSQIIGVDYMQLRSGGARGGTCPQARSTNGIGLFFFFHLNNRYI